MKFQRCSCALLALLCAGSMVACGRGTTPAASSASSSSGGAASANRDPMGRLDEPVTLTAVLSVSAPDPEIDADVKKPEQNYYLEVLRDQYNIEIDYIWAVPTEQFTQKFSIAMTSGDLPDILSSLDDVQYATLAKNDRVADLSGSMDLAVPTLMEYWQRIPEIFGIYNKDGKQLALPQYWDPRRAVMLMYIRQDWLDKLGMEIPKTVEEYKEVCRAFVQDDPDGNGQDDTFSMQLSKNYATTAQQANTVSAYLQMFEAYVNRWVDDGSGNLIPGIIQPEVKQGLQFLADMYKEGLIDPEFVVKDSSKITEQAVAGKNGIMFGPWWVASTTPYTAMVKTPGVQYVAAPIPGVDGPAKSVVDRVSVGSVTCLNAKSQDKADAFIKMLNFSHIWEDYTFDDYKGEFFTKLTVPVDSVKREHRSVWQWHPGSSTLDPFDIDTQYVVSNEAYAKNDPSLLTIGKTHRFFTQFAQFEQMEKGEIPYDQELSGFIARAKPDGSWKVTRDVFEAGDIVYNEKYGIATKTEQTKGTTLDTMAQELFVKIIMNQAPVDDFDQFVENWKKLGGDEITKEVQEDYTKQKLA